MKNLLEKASIILLLVIMLLCSSTAGAITATMITGAIKISLNETPIVLEKAIGVKNDNNLTIYVFFQPSPDLIGMVSMENYNISLEPGEERFVKFNLTINENKAYNSRIVALFSEDNSPNVTGSDINFDKLGMEMKLVIKPYPGNNVTQSKNESE